MNSPERIMYNKTEYVRIDIFESKENALITMGHMYYRLRRKKVIKLKYRIGTAIKEFAERKGIKSLVGFGYRLRGHIS